MLVELTPDGITIALIAAGMSIMSILVRMAVLDKDKMKDMREKMKAKQGDLKEATKAGDKKKASKIQEEVLELTMKNMKMSFKPMIFTMIPFLVVFGWLRDQFTGSGDVIFLIGYPLGWLGCYIFFSMVISMIANKVFGLT